MGVLKTAATSAAVLTASLVAAPDQADAGVRLSFGNYGYGGGYGYGG